MRRATGFTLVELVMVIVLLSIVATISVQFVALSTRGALDLSARQQRALQGVVVSEQVSRELREAFPLSVRTSGNCLEWIPLVAGTSYVELTTGPDFDMLSVAPFSGPTAADSNRVMVYGYGTSTSALYGSSNPGPVSPVIDVIDNAASPATIQLSAGHRFGERSPERRLFVVGPPVSLCQNGRFLHRYSGYSASAAQPTPPAVAPEVLAAELSGNADFKFTPATFRRAAVAQFTFTLADPQGDETTTFSQEVQLRNVP